MARKIKQPSVLAFDSSTPILTLAYHAPEVRCRQSAVALKSAGGILGALTAFLKKHDIRVADTDLIAVGTGPGSFTGLRVGVTCAKTLAYASGAKLVGISTLRTIAQNAPKTKPVCVALDARRGNVYTAVYHMGRAVKSPRLMPIAQFAQSVALGTFYIGDAMTVYSEDILKATRGRIGSTAPEGWHPKAARMIDVALERWAAGEFDDPLKLVPEYLYGNECMVTRPALIKNKGHVKKHA